MSEICEHETFKDICGTCHRDAQITRLTAEVESLKVEARISYAEGFHDGDENGSKIKREFVEKLESETKKLRAALEAICMMDISWVGDAFKLKDIARAALEGKHE